MFSLLRRLSTIATPRRRPVNRGPVAGAPRTTPRAGGGLGTILRRFLR